MFETCLDSLMSFCCTQLKTIVGDIESKSVGTLLWNWLSYYSFLYFVSKVKISGPTGPFPNVSEPTTGLYGKLPHVPDAKKSGFS